MVSMPSSATSRVSSVLDHPPNRLLGRARQTLLTLILQLVSEQGVPFSASERERLANEVLDEVFGLGPLEPLLKDPTVNDILVNTYESVYVERGGVLEKTNVSFKDNTHQIGRASCRERVYISVG